MTQANIHTALGQLKIIKDRIEHERKFISDYALRPATQVDPFIVQGGTPAKIAAAQDRIYDLERNIVAIMMAISEANAAFKLNILGEEHSVSYWLTWRREVYPERLSALENIYNGLQASRRKSSQAQFLSAEEAARQAPAANQVVVNFDEAKLIDDIAKLRQVFLEIDSALSTFNAVTTVVLP